MKHGSFNFCIFIGNFIFKAEIHLSTILNSIFEIDDIQFTNKQDSELSRLIQDTRWMFKKVDSRVHKQANKE